MEKELQKNKVHTILLIISAFLLPMLLFGVSDFLEFKAVEDIIRTELLILLVSVMLLVFWLQKKECVQYWTMVLISWMVAYVCRFLPVESWPVCVVFLVWALLLSNAIAYVVPNLILGALTFDKTNSLPVFLCYFMLSLLIINLFDDKRFEEKVWKAELVFGVFFLLCQGIFLYGMNLTSLKLVSIGITMGNMLLSCVLIWLFLRFYQTNILHFHKEFYSSYINPEREELLQLKKRNPVAYKTAVHTAYFCDRFSGLVQSPSEPIRCAALYHDMQEITNFPEEVRRIWREVDGPMDGYLHKDAILFICAESIVGTILSLNLKNGCKKTSYEKDIDKIFEYLERKKIGSNSDMSMTEWGDLKNAFREEKMYYDFLC